MSACAKLLEVRPNRVYQESGISAVDSAVRERCVKRMIVAMATGTGKTHIAVQLPERLRARRTLVITPANREVTLQMRDAMAAVGAVGLEMGRHRARADDEIVVACSATIARSPARLERLAPDTFDLVIADEAHHNLSKQMLPVWRRLDFLDADGAKTEDPPRVLVGFSATPTRGDGSPLSDLYDEVAYALTLPQAIELGALVPIEAFSIMTKTSLDDVPIRNGDYCERALERAINTEERTAAAFDAVQRHASGGRGLIFCETIGHAMAVAAHFSSRGREARVVYGMMDAHHGRGARAAAFKWFIETPGAILVNCEVIGEGVDLPEVDFVVMAGATRSIVKYMQRMGRATRLARGARDISESRALGKEKALILDLVDCTAITGKRAFDVRQMFGLSSKVPLEGQQVLAEKARQDELAEVERRAREEAEREAHRVATLSRPVNLFGVNEADTLLAYANEAAADLPSASMSWLKIGGGYEITKTRGNVVRIDRRPGGQWEATHHDFTGVRVFSGSIGFFGNLDDAVREAEACIRRSIPEHEARWLDRRARSWRPSWKQLEAARDANIEMPADMNSGEVSNALAAIYALRRRRKHGL